MGRRALGQLTQILQASQRTATVEQEIGRYRSARVTEHHLRPRTVQEYGEALDHFVAQVGGLNVEALAVEHVSAWLDTIPRGSRTRCFSAISAAVRWLDRHGCSGIAEALPARRPKARRYTQYLADHELAEAWETIEQAQRERWVRPWMADALRFALLVPLRRGELASLRHLEVDRIGRRLLLEDAKTGDRIVPIGPVALGILERQPRASAYVWPGNAGRGHVHGNSIYHAWAKVRARAGLRPLRFHGLRHSWASKSVRDGDALEHTRRVLGHSTEWMSSTYAHMQAHEVRGMVERIEQAIVTPAPTQCELFT